MNAVIGRNAYQLTFFSKVNCRRSFITRKATQKIVATCDVLDLWDVLVLLGCVGVSGNNLAEAADCGR
jgi:hypothetical protein